MDVNDTLFYSDMLWSCRTVIRELHVKLLRFTLAHSAVIIVKISLPFLFTAYITVLYRCIFTALVCLQQTCAILFI
jgi:hypothetical protein